MAPSLLALALLLALPCGAAALAPRAYLYPNKYCNSSGIPLEAWSDVCSTYSGGYGMALSACSAGVNATFTIFSTPDGSCTSPALYTYTATAACTQTAYGSYVQLAPPSAPCALAPATLYLVSGPLPSANCSSASPIAYSPTLVGACAATGYSGQLGFPSNTTLNAAAATLTSAAFPPGTCSGALPPYSYAGLPVNGTCGRGVGGGGGSYLARIAAPYVPPPPPLPLTPGQHTVALFSDAACTQSQGYLDAWTDRCNVRGFSGLDVVLSACSAGASVTVSISNPSAASPCNGQQISTATITSTCAPFPFFSDRYAKLAAPNPTACALGAEPLFSVSTPFATANCSQEAGPYSAVRAGACFDGQFYGVYPAAATYSAASGTLSMTTFNPGACTTPISIYTFSDVPVNGSCSQGFKVFLAPPYTPAPPIVPAEHTLAFFRCG
jgi:hypothetical protein